MFRLVADITELNIDQVKLPKIPGLGMLTVSYTHLTLPTNSLV